MLRMFRNKKGQSTVEYVLMATAVIAVIVGLAVVPNSPFRTKLNSVMNGSIDGMGTMSDRLVDSHTTPPPTP